jgi:transposase-like protein
LLIAIWWYLGFNPSNRDVEPLLAGRGVEVDHGTVFRWMQRFTARCRRGPVHLARTG